MGGRTRVQPGSATYLTPGFSGAGVPGEHIDMITIDIPCSCTWGVIRTGPGRQCVSRLRYLSAGCWHKHAPQPPALALVPAGGS